MATSNTGAMPATTEQAAEAIRTERLAQAHDQLAAMTDEGFLSLLEQLQRLEDQTKLPEAAGSVNFHLRGTSGGLMQVTIRDVSVFSALDTAMSFAQYASRTYGLSVEPKNAPDAGGRTARETNTVPAGAPAATPQAPVSPAQHSAPSAVPTPAPVTGGNSGENRKHICYMEVAARAGGRADVLLYDSDRAQPHNKFPDLKINNLEVGKLAKIFSEHTGMGWEDSHFSITTSYNVDFVAVWRNSEKLNNAGNPYKNVVRIEAA